jgi:myo-inositol-1(or 4)-monophosphatase
VTIDGPERARNYDARVRPELAAAHAAVDEAVKILRDGRSRPHKRIGKAAKDFLTQVDLASESAMQRSLAGSTPNIGFYGEEGGGAALESGRVWVADPLDGTINYATGSPLCGVMLGLLGHTVPLLAANGGHSSKPTGVSSTTPDTAWNISKLVI